MLRLMNANRNEYQIDINLIEKIHDLISQIQTCVIFFLRFFLSMLITVQEANTIHEELFADTSLEVGKTLSKTERDKKNLSQSKVTERLFSFRNSRQLID